MGNKTIQTIDGRIVDIIVDEGRGGDIIKTGAVDGMTARGYDEGTRVVFESKLKREVCEWMVPIIRALDNNVEEMAIYPYPDGMEVLLDSEDKEWFVDDFVPENDIEILYSVKRPLYCKFDVGCVESVCGV